MRTIIPNTSFITEHHGAASVGIPITVSNEVAADLVRAGHAAKPEYTTEIPDGVVPGETPGWPVDEDGHVVVLAAHIREHLGYRPDETTVLELEPALDADGNPLDLSQVCFVCGEPMPDAIAGEPAWSIPGRGTAHVECVQADADGNPILEPGPATSPVTAEGPVTREGRTAEYYAGLTYKQLRELNKTYDLGHPGNAPAEVLRAAVQEHEAELLAAAAAPPSVAAELGEVVVPEGVIPGETPGWPVDAETGEPLALTDEERQQLADSELGSDA